MRLVTEQAVGHAFGLFLVREHAFGDDITRAEQMRVVPNSTLD